MKRTFVKIITFTLIIGFIGLSLNVFFGMNTITYITRTETNGIVYYRYDFWNYLESVKTAFETTPIFELNLPTKEWQELDGNILSIQMWQKLGNNLALMLDYLIMVLNFITYPFRIVGYILRVILALIGITLTGQSNNPLAWLIKVSNSLIGLEVPYTPDVL